MRSNCVIFAALLWLRRWRLAERPSISFRLSDSGPFLHFLYQETRRGRVRQISYKPVAPVRRLLPPPLFRGMVRWGDGH